MDLQQALSHKGDFDPIHLIRTILAANKPNSKPQSPHNPYAQQPSASIQDQVEETLRSINNLSFKLQMLGTESSNVLNHSTQIVLNEVSNLRNGEGLNGNLNGVVDAHQFDMQPNNQHKDQIKQEFNQLHLTDTRINRCKHMSQEIEHFENRISKVEEYIRQNRFQELTQLIQQLQESLKVVRDISFFEKQKQRIERFDKMIMQYLLSKEKELVFDNDMYKQNSADIKALVSLQQYFNREIQFIDQLISQKLIKDFEQTLQKQTGEGSQMDQLVFNSRFYPKFVQALIQFLEQQKSFINEVFSDQANLIKHVYEQILQQISNDYGDKLVSEFVNSIGIDQQVEVFEQYYVRMLEQTRLLIPNNVQLDDNIYNLLRELYQQLLDKYKKQIDSSMSDTFESILEKDSLTEWDRHFDKVLYAIEKTLANDIEICQCYELGSLVQSVLKGLERFMMQLCYHIGQFSNKKMHYGVPNPNNTGIAAGADDQQCMLYEQKFKWQNLFDYITLHMQLLQFFDQLKSIDQNLSQSLEKVALMFERDSVQKKVSAFIAQKNTVYFKQLQKFLSPSTTALIFTQDQTAKNLEAKVFKQELLSEAVRMNFLRAFVMPIFKELSNINLFSLWKQQLNSMTINAKNTQKQLSLLLPEPGEYIRKIGEHFISFIHKLDSSQVIQECDTKINLYNKYCTANSDEAIESSGAYWIGEIGLFLCQTVSQKYLRINYLSQDGERQLISDVIYVKKLIQQFCSLPSQAFETLDSIVIGLTIPNRDGPVKLLMETPQASETLRQLLGIEELDQLQVNDQIVKAVQTKRRS